MTDTTLDLGPQTRVIARLADGVREDQLAARTPCPDCSVRTLLGHVLGLSVAFRNAARKDLGALTDSAPDVTASDPGPDWRAELPKVLDELAEAWRDPPPGPA